jgi:trimethylamine--corrinoid protein Co-methyltransferase
MKDCEIFAIKMAQALGINMNCEMDSASPLTIYEGSVEAALRYIDAGIPIEPTAGGLMGSSGPATNAGSLVQAVAQVMGWAVISQSYKPGAPISIQHGAGSMDMKRGTPTFGSVSGAMSCAMINQMLQKYKIPACPGSGFSSDSKVIDYQVGYEKALGAILNGLSGANLQIFQGGSTGELAYHPVLSILDDDVAGWVGRFLAGVTVTDETMAIDLINQVGPIPGHYLSTAHTREWWQKEQFIPKVADREPYPVWIKSGKKDALALAKERMDEILATHSPTPFTSKQEQSIEDILKEAREYYRKNGLISDEEWSDYMKALSTSR